MLTRLPTAGTSGPRCHRAKQFSLTRATLRHHQVATPHSGYHYDGTSRRFFEGWYWKVTIPENGQSFALIYSIEDPRGNVLQSGVGLQVMGPDDGYICQFSKDVKSFWASRNSLELGATFQRAAPGVSPPKGMVSQDMFGRSVSQGFQASSTWQQGAMVASERGAVGDSLSTVSSASWALSITPLVGWGNAPTPHAPHTSSKPLPRPAPLPAHPPAAHSHSTQAHLPSSSDVPYDPPTPAMAFEASTPAAPSHMPTAPTDHSHNGSTGALAPTPPPPAPPSAPSSAPVVNSGVGGYGLGPGPGPGSLGAQLLSVASASLLGQISPASQRATAGWLSALPLFEPHWQVLMAHGTASGWLQWGDKRYEFTDAPAYAEKNWGGGFPSKWCWVQCNTFDGHAGLSVTAVGARRALLLGLPGVEEEVGLIGVHLPDGAFIELLPYNSVLEWDVDPWGRWALRASNDQYEAVLEATCKPEAGAVLRAPTTAFGLAPFCKDTFFGSCHLRVWRKGASTPLVDARSTTAALEVGGGPWWNAWRARAEMKEPLRSLVQLPVDLAALGSLVPPILRPPGL